MQQFAGEIFTIFHSWIRDERRFYKLKNSDVDDIIGTIWGGGGGGGTESWVHVPHPGQCHDVVRPWS